MHELPIIFFFMISISFYCYSFIILMVSLLGFRPLALQGLVHYIDINSCLGLILPASVYWTPFTIGRNGTQLDTDIGKQKYV